MKNNKLTNFLEAKGMSVLAEKYKSFLKSSPDIKHDETLTNQLFANVELKHQYAKTLFKQVLEGDIALMRDIQDSRLHSFLLYRLYVHILNAPIEGPMGKEAMWSVASCILSLTENFHIEEGCYLDGYCLHCSNEYAPVKMTLEGTLFHPAYRLFTINLLCFRDKKVLLGYRMDNYTPQSLPCHKGCQPVGIKKDAQGREWFLMKASMEWSDDHTAIFSSWADGDATIEICDWVNENDIRVIFRTNI